MIGRTNSDASANLLKSQAKAGQNRMFENHAVCAVAALFGSVLAQSLPAFRAPRATPRGGLRATEGLPPAQRPVSLSGQSRVEK